MNNATTFPVIRRCDASGLICEPGCNCDLVTVDVDVDELSDVEIAHFRANGSAAQKAEIAAYLAPEVPMFRNPSVIMSCDYKPTPEAHGPECPCSDCRAANIPRTHAEGCGCLLCLVESMKATPRPHAA